jgi:dynein heavy chain
LNDTYILEVGSLEWTNPVKMNLEGKEEAEIESLMPDPRSCSAAAFSEGKVYLFGGHGGYNYRRVAFNDLWCFDLATGHWSKIEYKNNPCEERGGHSLFIIGKHLFVYGGWNLETQFNDIARFDLETNEWYDPEIYNEIPRWNFCSVMVEAIPSWKYFIFGGECGSFPEGGARKFGTFTNTSCVLDIDTMSWMTVKTEDHEEEAGAFLPLEREYSSLIYDTKNYRLVVFGGWANEWLSDVYALNVSSIVGPPYAITEVVPNLGQLTGGTHIEIRGIGFKDTSDIKVRFSVGKLFAEVGGNYVSPTEISCITPSFEHIGAKECEVRVSIQGGDLTNTVQKFSFFHNTRADKCLAWGAGLLQGCSAAPSGEVVAFFIQARNEFGENRKSGNDRFSVKVTTIGDQVKELESKIDDNDNGTYLVSYKCPEAGEVKIDISFENEKQKMVPIRGAPYYASFSEGVPSSVNEVDSSLVSKYVSHSLEQISEFISTTSKGINLKDKDVENDVKELIGVMELVQAVHSRNDEFILWLDCVDETLKYFQKHDKAKDSQVKSIKKAFDNWQHLRKLAKETKKEIASTVENEKEKTKTLIKRLEEDVKVYTNELKKREFYYYKTGPEEAQQKLGGVGVEIKDFEIKIEDYEFNADKFGIKELVEASHNSVDNIKIEVESMNILWDHIKLCEGTFEEYMTTKWIETKPYDMEEDVKRLMKTTKDIKVDKKCNAYTGLVTNIKSWLTFLPLIAELRDEAMRERHWTALKKEIKKDFEIDDKLTLRDVFNLNLNQQVETVEEITDQAKQEARMEKTLNRLEELYATVEFEIQQHKNTDVSLLKMNEDDFEQLEENQVAVNAMFSSRFLVTFEDRCNYWQKSLAGIAEVYQILSEVQRSWSFLENLFIHSEEVKKELPAETEKFVGIDREVKAILSDGKRIVKPLDFCNQNDIMTRLEEVQKLLNVCEKALNDFMDGKRRSFPRFYFVSTTDLLDILSNGNNPSKVMTHMPKIFQAINTLFLKSDGDKPTATGFESCVGTEEVQFDTPLKLVGKVESYLADVINKMRETLKIISSKSNRAKDTMERHDWLIMDPSQVTLLMNLISWVTNVETSMKAGSLAKMLEKQKEMLLGLIGIVRTPIERNVRVKVMCMITMDTHSRDIIEILLNERVKTPDEFQWQAQLKAYWNMERDDCNLRITDASFWYGYEYLGNGARLVVTPLTDRIYVTATQALHLKMGCAPAGPAGTGKTETTKDLSSAMGKACYVFNCSDQMDYKGMGGIFKGLASSGSWGCFDEFNRLVPEVLSVCSVQFKSVTDAIREGVSRFRIQDDEISLDPTCGVFITMNPGYLGRSELPEGLKALFRPITVVVPDLELICENMLMAEGFTGAKLLAKKFTTLYALCKDLLSKQRHYDWGLRAIKSVLVVAGGFKRAEPDLDERALLMRALRDFNLPKIVAEDLDIFMGLINDLFPNIDVPRKRDLEFEAHVQAAVKEFKLYPDPKFILKVVQLRELLEIRHCVFIIGPPGAGKSSTWKSLAKAQEISGEKTTYVDINPKSISTNELYGYVLMSTREWKDGLLSKMMRSLVQEPNTNPKWLVLDGDLDANWIESMNSVMDDNKILTLASNERIPLRPHMRMIFEIRDLVYASPATVSRAGILFISDSDGYQWKSYVKSWISSKKYGDEVNDQLQMLFDKYVPETLLHLKKYFKYVVPVVDIQMIIAICKLLESILDFQEVQGLEYFFVFACVWSIGAGFTEVDGKDYRKEFSNWWKDKWKTIKYPSRGGVFDYYVDIKNSKLEEWGKMLDKEYKVDTTKPISNFTVPTTDTTSFQWLMRQFINVGHSPLLVGNAGCGKTQISKGLLNDLSADGEHYTYQIINFNYYTDSMLLQTIMEQNLEKRAGKTYAPPGKAKLIYFVDDLNMPKLDAYNTQTAIALLRQHADYGHWYDRTKMQLKDIINTLKFACMNPTAGSFFVNPRLQRHFWMLAIPFPESSSLFTIYSAFLTTHFSKFKGSIQENVASIIKTTLQVHSEVEKNFRKTAKNFHYEFNVRHLTNIFQGLLVAKPEAIKEPESLIKLWIHETERIYGDRLVSKQHINIFKQELGSLVKKTFAKFNMTKYFNDTPELIVFARFVSGLEENLYDQFPSVDHMSARLHEALREYNDTNPQMDLVLFEDAMSHVCRICRIISSDGGHALLVGVGGSGKQSLSRLSSFILSYHTKSILISSSYGMNELKQDLIDMYGKAGVKDEGVCFLFTEGQITNEKFLVYINDLLSSGEIPDLYDAEGKDGIVNNIRPAVKGAGILDNKENCWHYFIQRVRKNLHMSICFSPVGESFRGRARKFPAIVNCTVIDWFQPWPEDALLSVARKFTDELEIDSEDVRKSVVEFMPYSFKIVNKCSEEILEIEKRHVYTTPKSFLELIKLFKVMFSKTKKELETAKDNYELGVVKLKETGEIVSKLEEDLKVKQVEVEDKKKVADEQAEIVGKEKAKVEIENEKAEKEAKNCAQIQKIVDEKLTSVQKDLDEALPLVEKAQEALKGLDIGEFRTMKAYNKPPKEIVQTFLCVLNILASIDKLVPTDKAGRYKAESDWKAALGLMKDPAYLIQLLTDVKDKVDKQQIPAYNFKAIRPTINDEKFTPEEIKTKSSACAGICDWILNITAYYDVVESVEPKRIAVKEAQLQLSEANERKSQMDALVEKLNGELAILQAAFQKAMDEKTEAESEAFRCARRLDLAQRLVNALGSESERWGTSIITITEQLKVVIGDVLLASAFVSYVGPFNKAFRDKIIYKEFIPYFGLKKIPMSRNSNPITILSDEATIAEWNNCKLPADKVSTENGCILTSSERFALMIDPQLQGVTWIKEKEKDNDLKIGRLTNMKRLTQMLEFAIEAGQPVLIENMEESIDAVLSSVYGRATIKRGKTVYLPLGDKEIPLSPKFKLYLHTKLSNPHYPPEIQAECALINFTVTEAGLEDQLLSLVVRKERPDLAQQKEELIQQQNEFKIKLKQLERDLLHQLTTAEGDLLENITLIENLESSKKISIEIQEKVEIAKVTEVNINEASEAYRPAASKGALVFFLMNELYKIHSFYKYSLDSFVIVVNRAIDLVTDKPKTANKSERPGKVKAPVEEGKNENEGEGAKAEGEGEEEVKDNIEADEVDEDEEEEVNELTPRSLKERVEKLGDSITYEAFVYTRRGLFVRHRLLVATMLCLRILVRRGDIDPEEVNALIKKEIPLDPKTQSESLKFMPEGAWAAVCGLEKVPIFASLPSHIENEALQWRKWYADEKAEELDLPKSCKDITFFQRLLLLRAMRPDRLTGALTKFIEENLGREFIDQAPFDIFRAYEEMNPKVPMFFVLFPGVDPTPEVERVGAANGITSNNGKFVNISMGQGQEEVAAEAIIKAGKEGGWVMLQNVHLMVTWMKIFERQLENVTESEDLNDDFRCFISSEPPPLPYMEIIPESILQNSIKVSNEAPQDLKANLHRAFAHFDTERFEQAPKPSEFKALLFGLCIFHALILGRRKFGCQGWSKQYNFNDGDLVICANVLENYLKNYKEIPYSDLQYIYGEIMYGGHITDDWDRRTNNTYLKVIIEPGLFSAMQLTRAPGFKSPDPNKFDRDRYEKYIEENLPAETPNMFGLHPNAEIGYLTSTAETLFMNIMTVQGGASTGGGKKQEDIVKEIIDKFLNDLPENFNMVEINSNITQINPYITVSLQECERMNQLLDEIRKSLSDLDAGLKGQLNITELMEQLSNSLSVNMVPATWTDKAYFSNKNLADWFFDLLLRVDQIAKWIEKLEVPISLWISGLFNPMSFLTAIMQVTSRLHSIPLDSMCLQTDVTNYLEVEELQARPEDGMYVHGLFLEGAKWEKGRGNEQGYLQEMDPKILHPNLPVMLVKAIQLEARIINGYYKCPVYVTTTRGPTFVFTAYLKMENDEDPGYDWVLAGVALLMSPD